MADELVPVAAGAYAAVLMLPRVYKEFSKADVSARAAIERIMQIYAREGSVNLPQTQFKNEARRPVGDRKRSTVLIQAFKGWQVRVYGANVQSRFICSEIDTSKKRDRADQDCLDRAAKYLAPYV